ncbi:zinc-dependent alcohol dehydrogenase family protein [Pseudohalocynthiibacter aestuariivivens]|jgi:alcohol dehydrogenase, propanol-preferring|uniref:alcohol dehydrogenase n=1 Tax=Pseudohalocynthiibacter aestuariivivens TaxID=1591409 RepID=A0ABV5JCM6_9RHOB|nr:MULTISPECIES: zinc-dependent alcohol dehydrogenase family protein [Pseudohalocynthiibacter]MBS9717301.1 zinc-dependent alcohol dehydrogenase family protein [Pseudohalocynthiibacter aestuariivivens]MCK0104230.1 zinc-dependent alcohol dehydrogenase family protein [Pseudohalocynthiibacter sp. F2068]
MRAMVLHAANSKLRLEHVARPSLRPNQVQIKVEACGVCRTDLHIVDGELTKPTLPLIPGHEIVGRVVAIGKEASGVRVGQRVGVPWLGHTCGTCNYCISDKENLCDNPGFTGYTLNGGFAEECIADARFVFPLPENADPVALAPLLCAGLIGYRSLRLAGDAKRLGIYGFGAAAHIIAQVAVWQGREIYALTRPGDIAAQDFARQIGAVWAGGSDEAPPTLLDAALIFAPVGALVPKALKALCKGGRVVCGGIHMSDIPAFPYTDLWNERHIMSVANLTRQDGEEFFPLAEKACVQTVTQAYPLEDANRALDDLKHGRLQGAAVLVPNFGT